ncbi:MAG TPA: YitT family protein [Chitinophagaceae bacterium]|nr:YitT family protein [Chitinophagaceae bacterium]
MQYEQAYSFLITKLETGLPSYLTYHDVQHTKNVIKAAEYLAEAENITGNDLVLLKTAALFHDAGFLQSHQDHEELSCRIARKYLPDYQYSPEQIEKICGMIMATKLPQTALDHLSGALCDADLFYLGTDDYNTEAEKLYKEFKKLELIGTHTEWQLRQAEFLSFHRYFTQTAIAQREEGKQANLNKLRVKIDETLVHHKGNKYVKFIQDTLLMLAGVIFAGLALKGFLVPNHFFDGGVTGMSLLLHEIYHFNLGLAIVLLNIPLIILGYFSIGPRFAFRMLAGVLLLGAAQQFLPDFDALTSDKLLISVFGGAFIGIGIGLVMRAGAALDGIEVLALYTLKRTSFTITEIILAINILIFTIAGFKFGIETSLYSILTYFTATRCIDYVVEGIQAYTGVTIISGKSEAIKYQLVNKLGRGITVYKGERGFLPGKFEISSEVDIIFTVVTRLELRRLKNLVHEADPNAFVFASTIKEASGGVLKRRQHH